MERGGGYGKKKTAMVQKQLDNRILRDASFKESTDKQINLIGNKLDAMTEQILYSVTVQTCRVGLKYARSEVEKNHYLNKIMELSNKNSIINPIVLDDIKEEEVDKENKEDELEE
jgi:hypothetical protein